MDQDSTNPQLIQNTLERKYKTCYPPEKCITNANMFSDILKNNKEIDRINNCLFSLGVYTDAMRESITYYGSGGGFAMLHKYIYSKTGDRYPGSYNLPLSSSERIEAKNHIANIDDAFRTSAPRYDDTIVTFRGSKKPYRHLNNVGDMEEIPAYISTSRDFDVALKFSEINEKGFVDDACCLYMYLISPGIPYIDFLSNRLGIQYELEVLLPRNLVLKYEGDVLLDTSKINFKTRTEQSEMDILKLEELQQRVLNGEITESEALKQYSEFSENKPSLQFTEAECVTEIAGQIKQLEKEANTLAIMNQLDLSRLTGPVKRTLATKLMNKFQGIRDLLMPRRGRDPVNTLTSEGKYKIKVLSVHAKQDNIYNIQPSTDPSINNDVTKSNIGGKKKTKRRRQKNKRSKRRD